MAVRAYNFQDLIGKKFNRLTVLKLEESRKGKLYWLCKCDCGKEKIICGNHLKRGNIKSCGCLQRELASTRSKKKAIYTR